MRKEDVYKKGMRDGLDPFSEKLNYVADTVNDTREILDDIIDCIEWNVDNPEELVNNLKAKKLKRTKPLQFRISIVYGRKEDESLADALRKDLNNQKNSCEIIDHSSFIKHAGSLVDYRIYIGNPEKFKLENSQVLYKAYGMHILQIGTSYVVDYNPKHKFTEDDKERFISYYESVISKSLEKSKMAENALKSRKKKKSKGPNSSDPKGTYAILDALETAFYNSLDFWDDKPFWLTLTLGLPSAVVSFLAYCISIICLIPVGISELVLRETANNLWESNFDNKFVADAQRQILEVKLVDLFKREQMRDIYDINYAKYATQNVEDNVKKCTPLQATQSIKVDTGNRFISTQNNFDMHQSPSTNIDVNGIIKELTRHSAPDALRIQIEGKVLEGNLTVGAYCKLYGQEQVYQVMTIGFAGNLTECEAGRSTKFTLKKI